MNPRTPRGRALLLLILSGAALVSWVATALAPGYEPHLGTLAGEFATTALTYVPLVALAALLVWRSPSHGVTRVLAVMAVSGGVGLITGALLDGRTSSQGPWDLPWVLSGLAWIGSLPMLPLLLLLFPTGSVPSPRWRPVLYALLAALAVLAALVVADADLSGGGPQTLAVSAAAVLVGGALAAAVGLVLRWRRSAGVQRAQLRMFALAAAAVAGWYVVTGLLVSVGLGIQTPVDLIAAPVAYISPVLATGYAVARHHLYGVDPVINRLAMWGIVSAVLLGGYLGAVTLLTSVSGAAQGSPTVAALVAGAVALCLAPVRSRVQRLVDRAMYGFRDDPLEMFRAAGKRLSAAVHPADVGLEIVRTATGSLRLPWAALDLETEGEWTRVAEVGVPPRNEPFLVPIRDAGEDVGRLLVAPRRGEGGLGERDARLLADLSTQAGPAVRAARMVTELTDSRERLIQARESERRRLQRDLHDGLSPALSGIGLSADAARRLLAVRPTMADGLLQRISVEARESAEVVRRMLADLRPAGLEDAGLVAAVTERAFLLQRPGEFDIRVRAPECLDVMSQGVQVAAYRITVEAMTNAARHSGGTCCDVLLEESDGHLRIAVTDDGHGLRYDALPGVGLTSMRERASEAGGHLTLDRVGRGLTVLAELPIPGGPR
jgi:signal transduction histidine kinase